MGHEFQTTHWSVILEAIGSSPGAERALEELCQAYWYPLYAFVRRQGNDAEAARDLTQSFFVKLLDSDYLKRVDPSAGRFRSFLLVSLKHFLSNERARERAQKRRADNPEFRITLDGAEDRYRNEASHGLDAETLFEKRWAMTVMNRSLERLAQEYASAGKRDLHDSIKDHVTGGGPGRPYAEIARRLGTSEGAIKIAVHRMRQRLGGLLREEVLATVSSAEQIDDELRYLLQALGS